MTVVDPDGVLLDDGAHVEILGGIVTGRADDLDAFLIGLVIGFRPLEGRQEAMVDVDDSTGKGIQ